jgi:photosystem II stability/assembly factor-like uncharacterized protein
MSWSIFICLSIFASTSLAQTSTAPNPGFQDPLDTPAVRAKGALRLEKQPVLALAVVKERIIGVGLRGLVIVSTDGGKSWRQSQVPIQSDLVSVMFPTDTLGWVVGHDGVILNTTDGGDTWNKQLDGRIAAKLFVATYQKLVDAGETTMQHYLDQAILNAKNPAALPFLGIHFENENTGYAVGSFGLILSTHDGGKTWEPWMHRIDNDQFVNFNDIRRIGSTLYIVGERGGVWRLDRLKQRFVSTPTDYRGSFFSIAGRDEHLLIVVGLGGNAFRSTDNGASWQQLSIGTQATLSSIITTSDGLFPLILSLDGEIFTSDSDWENFRSVPINRSMLFASNLAIDKPGQFILAGYRGVETISTPPMPVAHPGDK